MIAGVAFGVDPWNHRVAKMEAWCGGPVALVRLPRNALATNQYVELEQPVYPRVVFLVGEYRWSRNRHGSRPLLGVYPKQSMRLVNMVTRMFRHPAHRPPDYVVLVGPRLGPHAAAMAEPLMATLGADVWFSSDPRTPWTRLTCFRTRQVHVLVRSRAASARPGPAAAGS